MRVSPAPLFLPAILVVAACSGERSASSDRDLTLAPSVASATASAVVSPEELGRPEIEHSRAPVDVGSRTTRVRVRVHAAGLGPVAAAPAEDPEPDAEANDPVEAGGHALAPGKSVSVIPATSGAGPALVPYSDYADQGEMLDRRPTWHVHGDRCIPGRGEVIPAADPPAGHVGL